MRLTTDKALVELAHGAGGRAMAQFLRDVIFPHFELNRFENGIGLPESDDGATIPLEKYEVVISTDSHTVFPLFFPGGDIGSLAAAGTINDVAMMGARPLVITSALVIEEGFPISELEKILESMAATAIEDKVAIIAGDTKVMPKGGVDQLVICTTGVGVVERGNVITDSQVQIGDKLIMTGTIGDHGIALLANREGLSFETDLVSDVAPLWSVVEQALQVGGIHAMKDPTRGGLAAALNEFAKKSGTGLWIDEDKLPYRREVLAASQMLGLDPLQVTCEGKALIAVDPENADAVLETIRKTKYGKEAEIIGEAREDRPGLVVMKTEVGGTRIIQHPWAEAIPRVC
ncbi:MAG: hydrogenase expression/formation protein HypE [Candidatus Hermodarchaeia archaeon]|jgi:hydrogenase expression/formation protein HypE